MKLFQLFSSDGFVNVIVFGSIIIPLGGLGSGNVVGAGLFYDASATDERTASVYTTTTGNLFLVQDGNTTTTG